MEVVCCGARHWKVMEAFVLSALPEIDLDKCTGCGDCVTECRANAIELVGGRAAVVRPQNCDYCTDCESICQAGAIRCPFEIWAPRTRH